MKRHAGECLILISIGAISAGTWMIYEPMGIITGGTLTGILGIVLLPLGSKGK